MSKINFPPEPPVPSDITLEEIKTLRSQFAPRILKDYIWLLVLTSNLVSCHNGAETVVMLYNLALDEATTSTSTDSEKKEASQTIQRLMQESIVKGSVLSGIPHALDAMFTLLAHIRETTPDYLLTAKDFARSDTLSQPISSLTQPAHTALRRVYKQNLDNIQYEKMGDNMQDLKFFTFEIHYGLILGNETIIGWETTELVVLASLVGQNCTSEILWHMRGCLRGGWSREEVESVRSVCKDTARRLGVRVDKVPSLDEVNEESND